MPNSTTFKGNKRKTALEILSKNELHHCPRCGLAFACQPNGQSTCVCFQFKLSEKVSSYLRATYVSCVCPDCLRELIIAEENKK